MSTEAAGPRWSTFPWAAAALTACAAVALAGVFRLVRRAGVELTVYRVDGARAQAIRTPESVPPEWTEEAREALARVGSFPIFDDAAIERARASLAALAWVKKVSPVERALPRT